MQITHDSLKKYSYSRCNEKYQPPTAIQVHQVENRIKNEETRQIIISEQDEKLETEVQQPYQQEIELFAQNQISSQSHNAPLSQSLQKTIKNTPTRKNLIFEPLILQNNANLPKSIINHNILQEGKGKNFLIVQQYNMKIDLHQSPKENEHIILPLNSQKQKTQYVESNHIFDPFHQEKEISMYLEQSQQVECQEEQEQQQDNQLNIEVLQPSQKNQEQEQVFLANESMDPDYNKEDYLKVIEDYIDFIKIVEYMDKDQIEQTILKHQHITSRKKYQLTIEPLIESMLFQQVPHNPYKKDTHQLMSSVDYVNFYDILKQHKLQLEKDDYNRGLSQFMSYQLTQQTVYFLKIKKEQIKWSTYLFNVLQQSRNEIAIILKIYEQLQQEPLYLLNQDIDAFSQQLSIMKADNIKILQSLFQKYKKKIQLKLKKLKQSNLIQLQKSKIHNHILSEYEELKDVIVVKQQDLKDTIQSYLPEAPINYLDIEQLLHQFNEIKKLTGKAKQYELQLNNFGIEYLPLSLQFEQQAFDIFSLYKIDIKGPSQKVKVLLKTKVGEFSWNHAIGQERQELKNLLLRQQKISEYYETIVSKYSQELNFVRVLKHGKNSFQQNITLLTQYLFIKQELLGTEISIFAYPLTDLQQITVSTNTFNDLKKETNSKVLAIQQLNSYKILETLTLILQQENYINVHSQLNQFKLKISSISFSSLIDPEIQLVLKYLKIALCFFPENTIHIYQQTETYQELEEQFGDIKQLSQLQEFQPLSASLRLFQLFEVFFNRKVQKQFDQIFQYLIDKSNEGCNYDDLIYLSNRIDLLYDYNRADLNNKYIKQGMINQIVDQPNLRELINLGRGFLEHLTELVNEDTDCDDIKFSNQKILDQIYEFDFPPEIHQTLTDISPLIKYHSSLQNYPNSKVFINSQFNLGVLIFQQYSEYLQACQQRVKRLLNGTIIKINTLKLDILNNIQFQTGEMTQFVPIRQLHNYVNYHYTDIQSIIFNNQNDVINKIAIISINGKRLKGQQQVQANELEIKIQYDKGKAQNASIFVDDLFFCICD